jgi:hypothetical protein
MIYMYTCITIEMKSIDDYVRSRQRDKFILNRKRIGCRLLTI